MAVMVLAAALCAGARLGAQERDQHPPFLEKTEVSSALVPVTVRDARGRLVADLDRKDFRLFVDGIEFPIRSFWREGGLPLALAFVLDTSGSMQGRRLREATQVIDEFVPQLGPRDEACLITFGGGEVKRRLAFGDDPRLMPQILETLRGYGTTALYDVVAAAPQIMEGAHNLRRAILLFTDGVDTASKLGPGQARRVLEELNDPLYVFGIEPPPPAEAHQVSYEDVLGSLAEASGGRYIPVNDLARMPEIGRALRRELSLRYIISFNTSGVGLVKWRRVEVKVEGGYQVVTRRGYLGTLP
jgi:Ca-activated chloride channel family protein